MKKLIFGFILGIVLMLVYCAVLWHMYEKATLFGPESDYIHELKEKYHKKKEALIKRFNMKQFKK